MSSDFFPITIGECCDLTTGFPFKSAHYIDNETGVRLVRGDNIIQGSLRWDGVKRWDPDNLDGALEAKYSLREDDVVLAMDRPWIEAGLKYSSINKNDLPCLLVQRVARLRAKGGVQQRLLKYIIGSKSFTHHVLSIQTGTAVPHISAKQISEYSFLLPPEGDQRAIVNILGTLDDKIELNRNINKTLEGIATALFKSWFVDFDPVRAKAEGQPTGLPDEVSELFPDSLEEAELGEIPSGWSVSSIKDQSSYLSRGISPKYCEHDEGVVVLNQKCIRGGAVDFSKSRRHDPSYKKIEGRTISRFDCLVNSTGVGTLGRVAIVPELEFGDVIVDSHVTIVRGTSEHSTFYLTNALLNRQQEIEALGQGSTGQTELSRTVLGDMALVMPPEDLLHAFYSSAVCLFEKRWLNEATSATLSSLRDTLLPRLISGELRVPDAEKMLEEAGI
ncbi:restriction endonuclease subunit S [Synechococcus sp. A15-44]|uniref:restriction endonuclease subunit S n=1 Tax=Synechococcus sp. A15-44 TaxID=1050646 RepID=UPI001644B81C|nr:restriction endonuclease subunit S [Synechococcus sp. A15-44]QNI63669.1 Putative Type I restriction-modification system S subunit [Synechococcus sp. A15-44]